MLSTRRRRILHIAADSWEAGGGKYVFIVSIYTNAKFVGIVRTFRTSYIFWLWRGSCPRTSWIRRRAPPGYSSQKTDPIKLVWIFNNRLTQCAMCITCACFFVLWGEGGWGCVAYLSYIVYTAKNHHPSHTIWLRQRTWNFYLRLFFIDHWSRRTATYLYASHIHAASSSCLHCIALVYSLHRSNQAHVGSHFFLFVC